MTEEPNDIATLPLWKNCIKRMRAEGLAYGATFPAEYFEKELRCKRDSLEFQFAVHSVRQELLNSGFYLSGRGQKGNAFTILQPAQNADVMGGLVSKAAKALRNAVTLGSNTDQTNLDDAEKRKLNGAVERASLRMILFHKHASIARAVAKSNPELLVAE